MGAVSADGPHFELSGAAGVLLDDLDNAAGTRFDQNRAAIYNRVTIVPDAVFLRHVVIGDAVFRQHRANADVLAILVRRTSLLDNIAAKAGALIDAEHAGDATDHAANHTADDRADGTRCSFAIPCASFNSPGNPLGLRHGGERHGGGESGYSDKAADHDISNDVG
jgi:hypothetical protein